MQDNKASLNSRSSIMSNILLGIILLALLTATVVVFNWRSDLYRRVAVDEQDQIIEWAQRSNIDIESLSLGADGLGADGLGGNDLERNDLDKNTNPLVFIEPHDQILPIISNRWDFDYWPIELIVQRVKLNTRGELILDDSVAEILITITSALPSDLDQENLSRLQVLIAANIADLPGQEFAALVINFYRYQEELQRWVDNNQLLASTDSIGASDASELQFRQSLKILRASIGEENATVIFGKQHALREYLFQRRHINENAELSAEEKQASLAALEKAFGESQQ